MNKVITTILNHRSIRKFEDKQLSDEQIRAIVSCAQSASTSSFIQAYSIIGIKEKEKKKKLAELAGNQAYVAENGHFFVFCADLYRHEMIGKMENKNVFPSIESKEKFMVSIIDASLAAQNAAVAAESMGLGICYIGGIRNNIEDVQQLLRTPKRVFPLFGLVVGYPAQEQEQKPRLLMEHVYHEEEYEQNEELYMNQLKQYDEIVSSYYKDRTSNKRNDRWTEQMATMLEKQSRMNMKTSVQKSLLDLN